MTDEPGFDVTILVANGPDVSFVLAPERLRKHVHPAIAGTAARGERTDLLAAAIENLSWVFDPRKDPNRPVFIDDATGATIIRPSAITMVRVTDPTLEQGPSPKRVGFMRTEREM